MQVKITERHFGGVEFAPEMRVLHLGGQSSANVETLEFILPESWKGKSVTLHIRRQDGTLPTPILLDEANSCAVGKEFTASSCGSWMLLALGENGFRALTRPAAYDCYETLATDGDAEISPTQYETFVAQVLAYANSAQSAAKEARNSAAEAAKDAAAAEKARQVTVTAAGQASSAQAAAREGAERAETAAARAEKAAPESGPVKSVNGKGGVVTLGAADVGAVPQDSSGYVKELRLSGQTLTLTMGDGSVRTMQTKDTTALTAMTGILGVEHGGTGKTTAMTAEDVGAYSKTAADEKFRLKPATAAALGGVKIGNGLSVEEDGTVSADSALAAYPVGSIYQSIVSTSPAALFGGTWERIAENRVLMGASDTNAAGTTAEAGLPNIKGDSWLRPNQGSMKENGCFHAITESTVRTPKLGLYSGDSSSSSTTVGFDASRSNAIYGGSDTVQPPAYYVYIWHRVA